MSVDCTFWSKFSKSAESATLVCRIVEQWLQPISFQYMTLPLYYRIASGFVHCGTGIVVYVTEPNVVLSTSARMRSPGAKAKAICLQSTKTGWAEVGPSAVFRSGLLRGRTDGLSTEQLHPTHLQKKKR